MTSCLVSIGKKKKIHSCKTTGTEFVITLKHEYAGIVPVRCRQWETIEIGREARLCLIKKKCNAYVILWYLLMRQRC